MPHILYGYQYFEEYTIVFLKQKPEYLNQIDAISSFYVIMPICQSCIIGYLVNK